MARQANILWIQTDEQRPDSLGCYGSNWAKTPNIDLLAEGGTVMRNCVCQSPVCVPSRSSQLTCLYPQEVNTMSNEVADRAPDGVFPKGTVTFPQLFAEAGYQTASVGKIHTPKHPTWQLELPGHILDLKYADYHELGPGYEDGAYNVVKRGTILAGTYPVFEGNPSRNHTDEAIKFLRDRNPDQPFLLRVSHNWPHTPVLVPPPFDRLYRFEEIPIQYYDEEAYKQRAAYSRALAFPRVTQGLSRDEYNQVWKDYMALVGYVDYEVGRLLAALKALDLEENTIVLFSSDHGRALGEVGQLSGKWSFDRNVWGVPFVWHWPGHIPEGEVRSDLCELLDTGQTLASLAGLANRAPSEWRGRDLFGAPPPPPDKQVVFGQIGWPNTQAPVLQIKQVKEYREKTAQMWANTYTFGILMRMGVRTQRYRMDITWMRDGRRVRFEEADGNFFDLESDPQERRNLWTDPDAQPVIATLNAELEKWFERMDKPEMVFGEVG